MKELKRDLVNNVADRYLTDKNTGDHFDTYNELLEVAGNGEEQKLASEYVDVEDSMDFTTVYELIELIEIGVYELEVLINNNNTPDPIKKIDWSELRKQKSSLIRTISGMLEGEEQDNLTGILHLIDAVQDYAVDELEISSIHVFDFEEEEE